MRKRIKLASVSVDENRFFSTVSLESDEITELEDNTVDIEMLRVGEFKHKIYGDLEITNDMLDSMIDNFNENVLGREVSFDWNHKAEAASAWLKELKNEDGVLIGTTELTADGKDSISEKKYGYFSIEYSDDFEDPENGESHGPTILGGALTNRPFISKLKKIEFSLEDSDISIYRLQIKEDKKMKKKDKSGNEIERDPAIKDEDLTLEDVKTKNIELEKKNDELEKKLKGDNDDDKIELQDFIVQQKEEMKKMSDKLEAMEVDKVDLQKDQKVSNDRYRLSEIERTCDNLLTSDHHHPAVVTVAKQIMLGDITEKKVIKFTETVGEAKDKKTVDIELSVKEAILKILEAIPKTQRANYNEKTRIGDDDITFTEEEENKIQEEGIARSFAKKGLQLVSKKG